MLVVNFAYLLIMKTKNAIAYYCFNRACKESIYFSDTIRVTYLPLTVATLSDDHFCSLCNGRLTSIIDIELRQAIYNRKKAAVYSSFAPTHIYQ